MKNVYYKNNLELLGQCVLITGGTGSFGSAMAKKLLKTYQPKKVIIFSRDEYKQYKLEDEFKNLGFKNYRFFIGDVRDQERLNLAFQAVDIVIHTAAMKHVTSSEYNPFECINTNVIGAQNIVNASINTKVKKVIALSTDKASSPINLYGATKLASDKLFVASNKITDGSVKFSVVRYGNVMGSRGSVIPFFKSCASSGEIPITDPRMTRFMISLDDAVNMVWHAFDVMMGGEIFVRKLPSMGIMDIAKAAAPHAKTKVVGIRPGEKLHEQMIGEEDAKHTYEYADHYKILPAIHGWSADPVRIKNGKKVADNFTYASNTNSQWMTVEQLSDWINLNLGDCSKV